MVPIVELHILTIYFEPPKRGQPLYKGQDVWSQGVLYNGGSTVYYYNDYYLYYKYVDFLIIIVTT